MILTQILYNLLNCSIDLITANCEYRVGEIEVNIKSVLCIESGMHLQCDAHKFYLLRLLRLPRAFQRGI